MPFQPDILVLSSDGSRPTLVIEVKSGKRDSLASEEQLKNYMGRMNIPTGILVTPNSFRVFRHSYRSHSPEAISKVADLPTTTVIPTPLVGNQPWELERLVQRWLERLQVSAAEISTEARDVLEENVLPAIYAGEIRAGEPRWRQ